MAKMRDAARLALAKRGVKNLPVEALYPLSDKEQSHFTEEDVNVLEKFVKDYMRGIK